jgi:hypothetical protein
MGSERRPSRERAPSLTGAGEGRAGLDSRHVNRGCGDPEIPDQGLVRNLAVAFVALAENRRGVDRCHIELTLGLEHLAPAGAHPE